MRSSQVVAQPVVAGEREPRSEERGHEPGIAQDRNPARLDEHTGMADGGRPHQAVDLKRLGSGTERFRPSHRRSGDRRVGELLTGARDVLGPGVAIPVAQLVATRRIGVPTGRHRRTRPAAGSAAAGSSGDGRRRPAPRPSGSVSRSPPAAVPHPAGSSTRLDGGLFDRRFGDRLLGGSALPRLASSATPAPRPAPASNASCRRSRRPRRSPCHRSSSRLR